jgi:hypothetical protein
MTINTDLRNVLATAFKGEFDGGTLTIYTAADAVLATITLPGPAFAAASGGAVAKTGTWSATASGSGVARKAIFSNAGTETAEVTIAETAAELIIDDEDIVSGGTVTVTSYTMTVPAS